jgi:hypothetical protein
MSIVFASILEYYEKHYFIICNWRKSHLLGEKNAECGPVLESFLLDKVRWAEGLRDRKRMLHALLTFKGFQQKIVRRLLGDLCRKCALIRPGLTARATSVHAVFLSVDATTPGDEEYRVSC